MLAKWQRTICRPLPINSNRLHQLAGTVSSHSAYVTTVIIPMAVVHPPFRNISCQFSCELLPKRLL